MKKIPTFFPLNKPKIPLKNSKIRTTDIIVPENGAFSVLFNKSESVT